jgi:hypothetical protein
MSIDPSVIAMMNACAEALQGVDYYLAGYIGNIAEKLVLDLPLTDDETSRFNWFTSFVIAHPVAPVQAQLAGPAGSLAPAVPNAMTLSLAPDQVTALQNLLSGQVDPILIGIAQNLAAESY